MTNPAHGASPADVRDPSLVQDGVNRIEWAAREMPVIRLIRERFAKEKPLSGQRIAACLHVTSETANLMLALRDGGATIALCASNPLSTQDDVAADLAYEYKVPTYAMKGEDTETYYRHLRATLEQRPTMTLDDGADLVAMLHKERRDLLAGVRAGMEETTTGVIRLKSMAADGKLAYPIIAVNEAETKHFFDNRYGTGQSTLDGIVRATNVLLAGKTVVVIGYGWCGRGIASRAKGMGSHVIVTEVEPVKALEAVMDGYQVMPIRQAAARGDIFITVTGGKHSLDAEHFRTMKPGALMANSGHFNVEINIPALEDLSVSRRTVKPYIEEFKLQDGRLLYLLAEGRLVNLAAAEGHPSSVMDMSFANQALCAEYVARLAQPLTPGVHVVPPEIDKEVGRLKLRAMGVEIDTLTEEQRRYLASWESGT
ncbi:MAG: adenosylhomocysteinase [Dehalococcoidia bacterium]|nr:adenosylhomocysteinase [Dehalococcoidia bacterium]